MATTIYFPFDVKARLRRDHIRTDQDARAEASHFDNVLFDELRAEFPTAQPSIHGPRVDAGCLHRSGWVALLFAAPDDFTKSAAFVQSSAFLWSVFRRALHKRFGRNLKSADVRIGQTTRQLPPTTAEAVEEAVTDSYSFHDAESATSDIVRHHPRAAAAVLIAWLALFVFFQWQSWRTAEDDARDRAELTTRIAALEAALKQRPTPPAVVNVTCPRQTVIVRPLH